MCGCLRVSKYHPRDEAFVSLRSKVEGQSVDYSTVGDVLIYGSINRYDNVQCM